jgi:Flp pilus assembly protein TadD
MNRPAEAVPHYEKVLAKYPKKIDVRANLGGTLVTLGRIDEALAHLQEAAKLSPNHYPVAANFAIALSHVGRHAEAIPHFRRAIEARPQEPFPHYGLAQAYLAVGQPDVARAEYEALRALDRNLASYLAGAFVTEW